MPKFLKCDVLILVIHLYIRVQLILKVLFHLNFEQFMR